MNRHSLLMLLLCALGWLLPFTTQAQRNNMVLVETESFKNPGGWTIDAQFMDQMGSPYVLAHGLGVPVAKTTVAFPETGKCRVFVRTKDWVANQGPGHSGPVSGVAERATSARNARH